MPASDVPFGPSLVRLNPFYPGQMGVPGTDSETGLRLDTNGTIFYVDPNAVGVSDGRDGTNPIEPLETVAAALTHCQDYCNDTIVVAPSAYWTYGDLTATRITPIYEEVTVNVHGVRIVGLMPSSGLGVPWNAIQNNGVMITVNAMDVLIEGFNFWEPSFANVAAIYAQWNSPTYYGENLTVRNNFFGYGLEYGVRMDYSWNSHIHHNEFQEVGTAAINSVDVFGDPDYAIIEHNKFMWCVAAIDLEDTDECIIHGNVIMGDDGGTANYIDISGGNECIVSDNWLGCTKAQYPVTCTDGVGNSLWVNNHCVDGDTLANA
jgi:hypothetical protein